MPNDIDTTKKSIDLTFFARLLISVAIILLVYGFYLDVGSTTQLIDPETASKNAGNKTEAVTMIDIYHWDESVGSMEIDEKPLDGKDIIKKPTSSGTGKTKSSSSGKNGESSNKSDNVKVSGSSKTGKSKDDSTSEASNTPNSSPQQSPVPVQTPSTPTLEQTNNNLRNQIQNTYGVTVRYGGMETSGYYVGGMSTNPITDASHVNSSLVKLNNAMSLYPNNFFREISDGGLSLTIYLIESYSIQGVTGVTDSNSNHANISIAVSYPFDETFHHENYHYIERYMMKKGISFRSWSGYNPSGFSYGKIDPNQSFSRTKSSNVYFVNDYAQSAADEDRASTFEYMMRSDKTECLSSGKPVWNKAKVMSDSIDAVMDCVTPYTQEYWERHL